jgi:hypothetical protein
MKLPILAFFLLLSLAGAVSDGKPPQPKPRYHCDCADICAKVPQEARCQVQLCNGNAEP